MVRISPYVSRSEVIVPIKLGHDGGAIGLRDDDNAGAVVVTPLPTPRETSLGFFSYRGSTALPPVSVSILRSGESTTLVLSVRRVPGAQHGVSLFHLW